MLVLTRKGGEQIVVPNCDLTVTVLGIEGNKVRLGFTAPSDVAVYREEIWRRICEEPVHATADSHRSAHS